MNAIHLAYGFHLFEKLQFDEAVIHFSQTFDDPRHIISLFPSLLPSETTFTAKPPYETEEWLKLQAVLSDVDTRTRALTSIIPYLTLKRVPLSKQGKFLEYINPGSFCDRSGSCRGS